MGVKGERICSGSMAGLALALSVAAPLSSAHAAAEAGTANGADRVVEVVQSAYHVPLFSNEYVTVVDVNMPPGRGSDFHHHRDDALNIYLVDYPSKAAGQDWGKPLGVLRGGKNMPRAGEILFKDFSVAPVINRGENLGEAGSAPMHVIETEFSGRRIFGFNPAERSSPYVKLLDNEKAKVWQIKLAPGETAPAIVQRGPGMRVVIQGGEIEEAAPGMRERGMWLNSGTVYWQDGRTERAIRNIGKTPVMLIEMEVK